MTTDYVSETDFLSYIGSDADLGNAAIQTAIGVASRGADAYTNRQFFQVTETRYFSADPFDPLGWYVLPIDDLATLDGLEVMSETMNTGLYPDSWTIDSDFIAEPQSRSGYGLTGIPYTQLRAVTGRTWPLRLYPYYRPGMKITGTWGWADTPEQVTQAVKILAGQLWKLGDALLGVAGWGEYGALRVREIPQVSMLLDPFRRGGGMGIA